MKFADHITINEHFKKSMNLKLDKGNIDFLEDFILSPSNQKNLDFLIKSSQNGQGAFTFTGPYGSGKSSFALFLSELLASTSIKSHTLCIKKISDENLKNNPYLSSSKNRKIIPIVGEPISPIYLLSKELNCDSEAKSIIQHLESEIKKDDGLILIIDEMGKLLENSASIHQNDIYLLQQIAELANSSNGKFIFIGILHQSFAEYASSLNKKSQNEWYKIHGRFYDLVIDTSNEEKLDLIGQTILSNEKPEEATPLIKATISTILQNRPINPKSYEDLLLACWPLSPVVALMLGPLSLKDFGQNQRSIFTFLSSEEPSSFNTFLISTNFDKKANYGVDDFWNYIKYNFDFLLSRSNDSRRWVLAQEVLDKLYAQASVTKVDVEASATILKFIALLDILKGNTGLVASKKLIKQLFIEPKSENQVEEILKKLGDLSLIRETYDKSGYVLFDGSDFDIDTALNDAQQQVLSIDYARLNKIASFQPIIAKKHYHETGTIRWMSLSLIPFKTWKNQTSTNSLKLDSTRFGAWLIIIPDDQTELEEAHALLEKRKDFDETAPILLGVTPYFELVNSQARELLALEWIEKNTPNLMGDRVARLEIDNRKNHLSLAIRETITSLKRELKWWKNNSIKQVNDVEMNRITSDLATKAFKFSPNLQTELLNTNTPSGSANGAVNALLKKMVFNKGDEELGFEKGKYPAEWGLYKILLDKTGIYRKNKEGTYFYFDDPIDEQLANLWFETDKFLKSHDKCTLKQVFEFWERPPYGIKKGLHTTLFLTYILTKEGNIAAYLQGIYLPEINDLFVDYLIKESREIEIKYIEMSNNRQDYVEQLHQELSTSFKSFKYCQPNVLDISRKMVSFINNLNPWVMRTKKLSRKTTRLRELLKNASDPNKLIFDDIVNLYNISLTNFHKNSISPILESLEELANAYPNLIKEISCILYTGLQINPNSINLNSLQQRAKNVSHATGDFRIDALASRLSNFNPDSEADIAGIASLAANKPIHDWIDLDLERAAIELGVLCDGFKKAELYTHLKGKPSNRRSFIVMSSFNGEDIQKDVDFSLPTESNKSINKIKEDIKSKLNKENDTSILKAALLELVLELS